MALQLLVLFFQKSLIGGLIVVVNGLYIHQLTDSILGHGDFIDEGAFELFLLMIGFGLSDTYLHERLLFVLMIDGIVVDI